MVAKWAKEELITLGPTFIKLGQLASSRSDLLTKEVTEELQSLQDNVPPFKNAFDAVSSEFSVPLDDVFCYFEPEPIASASLGQCHRATLMDGTEVVVKVQRPDMEKTITEDIDAVKLISRLLFLVTRDENFKEFVDILGEWKPLITGELDYLEEADNMEQFSEQFEGTRWVKVPKVYKDLSTKRVLVMEYEPGVKITNIEGLENINADLKDVAFYVIKSQYIQILEKGLFHADPHPGNLALNEKGEIVYYDYGLMMRIDPSYKENLYALLDAVYKKDIDRICNLMIDLNIIIPTGDRNSIKSFVKIFLNYVESVNLEQLDVEELKQLEEDRPFRLSTMWILLIKSIYSVEGIAKTLSPEISLSDVLEPYAEQVLDESGLVTNAFADIRNITLGMPRAIQSIRATVDSLETGNISMKRRMALNEKNTKRNEQIQFGILLLVFSNIFPEQNYLLTALAMFMVIKSRF
jgi:predicted unusual protein kinase regulating ubiquinone biosynthesis (AarF/ABC1/UbiB family)